MNAADFMARAIALSRQALETEGAAPYGAVVVRAGEIVGEGLNHVRARHDPTSHGEVEAIRDACRRLGTTDLSDCDLYSSCEPCAMCVAAMSLAGIRKLVYAASLSDSAETLGHVSPKVRTRIDSGLLRREAGLPPGERRMPSEQIGREAAMAAMESWAKAVGGEAR
ncbi:nucleoside deaminase [uncultured Enterovirga sp.]|uniref:nucleoside deaminase n=1 Tax=uncultured Enterovirga sp. TaxID=2026352 RepID=UPI0035C9705E